MYLKSTHAHFLKIEFAILGCLFIYFADDDLVRVETCRGIISDKWLFIIDCANCWIKFCIIPYVVSSFLCFSSILSFFLSRSLPFLVAFILLSFFPYCISLFMFISEILLLVVSDTFLMS